MRKIVNIAIAVLVALPIGAKVYYLDLQQSIMIAKDGSYTMKSLKEDSLISENSLKSSLASLKTHIDFDLTIPQYTETVRSFEDTAGISYYPVRQLNYNGSLTVNQPLITNGRVYLTTGLTNTDDIYNSKRLMNLNTRIGFSQPIDAFYGYNTIKSTIQQAKLNYEQTQKQLKRSDLDLMYNVSSSFYNLLQVQKNLEISALNLERQAEANTIAQNKYAAGLIKEVDALQMEVDLATAQNSYDMAVMNVTSAENAFKKLIGLKLSDSVVLNMDLKYEAVLIDVDKAVELAMKNRLEIREQEIQAELNKMSLKRQKAQGLPTASLTGYFEKSGVSSLSDENTFGTSLSKMGDNYLERPINYGLGLTVSIPILDFGENKSQVRVAESRLKKTYLQQEETRRSIETEVKNLVAEVNSSLKRLQLLEKNIVIAEKSFEITRARFADGDIDSQALALERDRLNNAHTSLLQAYITYQLKLADLTRNTFYDFVNNVEIE